MSVKEKTNGLKYTPYSKEKKSQRGKVVIPEASNPRPWETSGSDDFHTYGPKCLRGWIKSLPSSPKKEKCDSNEIEVINLSFLNSFL